MGNSLTFAFDRIFDQDATQREIYGEVGKGLVSTQRLN